MDPSSPIQTHRTLRQTSSSREADTSTKNVSRQKNNDRGRWRPAFQVLKWVLKSTLLKWRRNFPIIYWTCPYEKVTTVSKIVHRENFISSFYRLQQALQKTWGEGDLNTERFSLIKESSWHIICLQANRWWNTNTFVKRSIRCSWRQSNARRGTWHAAAPEALPGDRM